MVHCLCATTQTVQQTTGEEATLVKQSLCRRSVTTMNLLTHQAWTQCLKYFSCVINVYSYSNTVKQRT